MEGVKWDTEYQPYGGDDMGEWVMSPNLFPTNCQNLKLPCLFTRARYSTSTCTCTGNRSFSGSFFYPASAADRLIILSQRSAENAPTFLRVSDIDAASLSAEMSPLGRGVPALISSPALMAALLSFTYVPRTTGSVVPSVFFFFLARS